MEGHKGGEPGRKLLFILSSSILLNALLLFHVFFSHGPDGMGWAREAVAEAVAVAAVSCSGHGRAFLDSRLVDGRPSCECNTCYAGDNCSVLLPDCPADAASGNPLFLEPYWQQHPESSAILMSGWHRMGYHTTSDHYTSVELERHIHLLHQAVGNAVTDGRFIVFGAGSAQLINAAVSALSSGTNASTPASVVASAPFFPLYKKQTNLFDSKEYEWKGITSDWVNRSISQPRDFIEIVTSPNNPDGLTHQSVLEGSVAIHDHAYYWPHFTAVSAPADEDLMLFSCSKASGHASSRFGWAVIKDEKIYQKMVLYVDRNTMGVSRDTQLRILKIIKAILAQIGEEGDIFQFGYKTQGERWRKLNKIISLSNRFTLQKLAPRYCNYFKRIRDPSPAYAWLKCEDEEDGDCASTLRNAGIISRSGHYYEGDRRHARLSIMKTQDDFDQLLQRFEALVSEEGASSV